MTNRNFNTNGMEHLDNGDMNDCISLIWKKIKAFFAPLHSIPEREIQAAELAC